MASSGSIVTQTSSFLKVVLFGIYTPGSGFSGFTASPVQADISLDQTGSFVSGSFTLATVPEPGALALWVREFQCVGVARWRRKVSPLPAVLRLFRFVSRSLEQQIRRTSLNRWQPAERPMQGAPPITYDTNRLS